VPEAEPCIDPGRPNASMLTQSTFPLKWTYIHALGSQNAKNIIFDEQLLAD